MVAHQEGEEDLNQGEQKIETERKRNNNQHFKNQRQNTLHVVFVEKVHQEHHT